MGDNQMLKTGIPGLDKVLQGGLLKQRFVVVSGVPGTGKTLFGMQFLLEGMKSGEKGLMICTEESPATVKQYAKGLNIDLDGYEEKKQLFFVRQEVSEKKLISLAAPLELIRKEKIQRVVLDSLTLFKYMHTAGPMDFRKELLSFLNIMRDAGVTLIVTAERKKASLDELAYNEYDFLFDGIIVLTRIRKGASFERCLTIQKMRGQAHAMDVFPYKIGPGGIVVYPDQPPFSLVEQDAARFQ